MATDPARRRVSDLAWRAVWRAVRAVATPYVTRELAAARDKLAARHRGGAIDRSALDRWLADAAPPGVPFESVVVAGRELASRFPDGPTERRGRHLIGKKRLTHRAIASESVVVIALYSDVAADYFVESMAADVALAIDDACGAGVAHADSHAGIPVVL